MANSKNDLVPFLTEVEIQKLVKSLARQIEHDYEGRELFVVCPLMGSIHFCSDLLKQLSLPVQVDFVVCKASARGATVGLVKDISFNIAGKHVLVVEEIIDTGRTLNFLLQRLEASMPASLRVVTLLDKPARRELPLKPDYVGRTIEDRFVVGYGMDSEDRGRNYKDIYFLKN
jgi:hypoxanthine phosphoribosyltransferase